jgi:hypothetical protein
VPPTPDRRRCISALARIPPDPLSPPLLSTHSREACSTTLPSALAQLASLEHRQAEEDPSGGDVGGAGDGGGDDRAAVPDPADGDADAAGPRVHGAGARARHEPPRLHPKVRRLLLPRGPPHQQVQEEQPLRPGQCFNLKLKLKPDPVPVPPHGVNSLPCFQFKLPLIRSAST